MKPSFILENAINLDGLFQTYRNHPALIAAGKIRSFADIVPALQDTVARLREAGIRKGHCVALHGANSELHLYLFLASWILDFLYIPLDFKAPLTSLVSDTPADFLVTDEILTSDLTFPVLGTHLALRCRSAETSEHKIMSKTSVISAQSGSKASAGTIRSRQIFSGHRVAPGMVKSAAMKRPSSLQKDIWPVIPFEREACAIFTSGSSGKPRGIVHTVGNYIYSALGTNAFIGLDASDRWLLSLPLFHVGGTMIWIRTLMAGAACILPSSLQNLEFSIREHLPTVISLVPAQLMRLSKKEEMVSLLKNMKCIMLGGAPSPRWLIDRSLELGLPIMPTYGCTESCAQITGVPAGSAASCYSTAGRVVPFRKIRLDESGVINIGGDTLFKRYLHDADTNPFDAGGFFQTADSGTIDDQGNLVIGGRTDGAFISGGENISPREIENVLLREEGTITAIVVPVPHREFGLTPWAFVETEAPFEENIRLDNLRKYLPGYKLPKRIIRLTADEKQGKMKYSRETLARLACRLAGVKPQTHLNYEETGPPDAPVIVFLHGFMGKAESWKTIMHSLADTFRCIAFDLPGHGLSLFTASRRLRQLRNIEDVGRLILDDLGGLGIGRFALYGYSMGGRVAQHIALAASGRVRRLILESASFGIADPEERAKRLKKDQSLLSGIHTSDDFRIFLNNWYEMPLFRTLRGTPYLQCLIGDKIRHPVVEFQQALNILSVGGHDFLAEKPALTHTPVDYFCGQEDEAYRQTASRIRLHLPEMTVRIFQKASHNISIQYPEEIARAIREILI